MKLAASSEPAPGGEEQQPQMRPARWWKTAVQLKGMCFEDNMQKDLGLLLRQHSPMMRASLLSPSCCFSQNSL